MITLNPAWQLGVDKRVGSHRGRQGRRPRDLQRPSVLARRARRADAGRRHRRTSTAAQGPRRDEPRRRRRGCAGEARAAGALVALLAAAAGAAPGRRRTARIAITGGRVVHGRRARPLETRHRADRGRQDRGGGRGPAPSRRARPSIDAAGKTVYPGLIDGLTTLGLTEIGSVAASVDTTEVGRRQPARQGLGRRCNPHSELIPVARANGVTAALAAPAGGLISGQSALIRLAGTTPDALTVKAPVAMHIVYPSGRAARSTSTTLFDEPQAADARGAASRTKKKNQEKDAATAWRNLLEEAKAYGAALGRPGRRPKRRPADGGAGSGGAAARSRWSCGPTTRTTSAARSTFAGERRLKLMIAGGLEAWRCADVLKKKDVRGAADRRPRCRGRESDPYDAAYANAAALHAAGVRFAIVTRQRVQPATCPTRRPWPAPTGCRRTPRCAPSRSSPAEIFGRRRPHGLARRWQGRQPVPRHRRHHGPPHRGHRTSSSTASRSRLETRHTRLYKEFKDR